MRFPTRRSKTRRRSYSSQCRESCGIHVSSLSVIYRPLFHHRRTSFERTCPGGYSYRVDFYGTPKIVASAPSSQGDLPHRSHLVFKCAQHVIITTSGQLPIYPSVFERRARSWNANLSGDVVPLSRRLRVSRPDQGAERSVKYAPPEPDRRAKGFLRACRVLSDGLSSVSMPAGRASRKEPEGNRLRLGNSIIAFCPVNSRHSKRRISRQRYSCQSCIPPSERNDVATVRNGIRRMSHKVSRC